RHGRPPLGVRRLALQPARAGEPSREPGRLHLDSRHRHDGRLVPLAEAEGTGGDWPRSRRAALAMIPAQDVLGLGSEDRMNRPGVVEGNWRWRLEQGQLTEELAARLRELAGLNHRLPR